MKSCRAKLSFSRLKFLLQFFASYSALVKIRVREKIFFVLIVRLLRKIVGLSSSEKKMLWIQRNFIDKWSIPAVRMREWTLNLWIYLKSTKHKNLSIFQSNSTLSKSHGWTSTRFVMFSVSYSINHSNSFPTSPGTFGCGIAAARSLFMESADWFAFISWENTSLDDSFRFWFSFGACWCRWRAAWLPRCFWRAFRRLPT